MKKCTACGFMPVPRWTHTDGKTYYSLACENEECPSKKGIDTPSDPNVIRIVGSIRRTADHETPADAENEWDAIAEEYRALGVVIDAMEVYRRRQDNGRALEHLQKVLAPIVEVLALRTTA